MPDIPLHDLPLMTPPRSAWPALQAQLESQRRARRRRVAFAFAAAAVLACAALLPRWLATPADAPSPVAQQTPAPSPLQALQQESAQLESLVAWSRSDGVELGAMGTLADAVQSRVAAIDTLLARDDLDPGAAVPLWQERVLRLRQLLDLETTQQLLAANGDADPGAPVLAF